MTQTRARGAWDDSAWFAFPPPTLPVRTGPDPVAEVRAYDRGDGVVQRIVVTQDGIYLGEFATVDEMRDAGFPMERMVLR